MKRLYAAVLLCLGGLGLCALAVKTVWYDPRRRICDLAWMQTATPGELRTVAHRVLLFPGGNDHDAFMILIRHGDRSSVPYLLGGLRRHDVLPGGLVRCTTSHCLDALRRITGHDAGDRYADWEAWWLSEGRQRMGL